nr:hypothetical protein Iba_chr04bCG1020 [Ipomoea batatas]
MELLNARSKQRRLSENDVAKSTIPVSDAEKSASPPCSPPSSPLSIIGYSSSGCFSPSRYFRPPLAFSYFISDPNLMIFLPMLAMRLHRQLQFELPGLPVYAAPSHGSLSILGSLIRLQMSIFAQPGLPQDSLANYKECVRELSSLSQALEQQAKHEKMVEKAAIADGFHFWKECWSGSEEHIALYTELAIVFGLWMLMRKCLYTSNLN